MENVPPHNCIERAELKQLIAEKKRDVKIVDVRNREEYEVSHIPGAIHIALPILELAGLLFDKGDHIITVCGKGGGRSAEAAKRLQNIGFKNANWLCGGTFAWIENL